MNSATLIKRIFKSHTAGKFNDLAVEIFRYQYENNAVYRQFVSHLNCRPQQVNSLEQIPFMPIGFFKEHRIYCGPAVPEHYFESSATTGSITSKHYYAQPGVYLKSLFGGFRHFYGNPEDYCILALLPSYLERGGSSLVFMVQQLIEASGHPGSGFYLHNHDELADKLSQLEAAGQKSLLIGVSFALLDLIEKHPFNLKHTTVMETGGMKGRRRELVREELHEQLRRGFGVNTIHSEYGMTELFSQAYSKGEGRFETPPWMQVMIRDVNDPLSLTGHGKTGGINVTDLANIHTCSFIATQDLGRTTADGTFEVLGRFDHSDVRGCNLMVV